MSYTPFNKFALRTPLLPFSKLEYFEEIFTGSDTLPLGQILGETILEAILVGSPDLYSAIDPAEPLSKTDEKTRMSLLKYLNRMSTRSTPFGLFSAMSIGAISEKTGIVLADFKKFKKYGRIDSFILMLFYHKLFSNEKFIRSQRYKLNETIYTMGDRYRFVSVIKSDIGYVHELTSFEKNAALKILLRNFRQKKTVAYVHIAESLSAFGDEPEIFEFIKELILSDILLIENNIAITGCEIIDQIHGLIKDLDFLEKERAFIDSLKQTIRAINLAPPGKSITEIASLDKSIKAFFPDLTYKYPIQVDTLSTIKTSELDRQISEEVLEAIHFLTELSPVIKVPGLDEFKKAFYQKYEEREVPLCEALDVEVGIGFPVPEKFIDNNILIKDINFRRNVPTGSVSLSQGDLFIINKYHEYLSGRQDEIVFTPSPRPSKDNERYSDTIFAQIEVFSGSREDIHTYLMYAGGSSAANYLTRFGYLDGTIGELIHEITRFENNANQNQLIAEIVHLPQPRAVNVILRPTIREYEIPYCSNSILPDKNVLELSDIMVSVKLGKQIVLRSKKLNKIIMPKLTSAHNYQQDNLPLYQLLAALQFQNTNPSIFFKWPTILQSKPFLPRVRYKNVALSIATWNYSIAKDGPHAKNIDFAGFRSGFLQYAEKYKLPETFFLTDGDNRLLLSTKTDMNLKILFYEIKKKGAIKLTEVLYNHQNMIVKNDAGADYLNEVILFYKKSK